MIYLFNINIYNIFNIEYNIYYLYVCACVYIYVHTHTGILILFILREKSKHITEI